jgi:hypothetical protein
VIVKGGGATVSAVLELPELPVASVAVTVKLYELVLAARAFDAEAWGWFAPAGGVP